MAISLRDERYRWLALLLYGLAAFIVAVLLVFGVRWIYRSVHDNNSPPTQQPVSTNNNPQPPAVPVPPSGSQNQSNNSSANTNSNNTVPNSGPGDVAALFIGTSAAAAGLHYFIRARKISS
jgi:uncharacterized membrane protein YraQ (UPF0718 family)